MTPNVLEITAVAIVFDDGFPCPLAFKVKTVSEASSTGRVHQLVKILKSKVGQPWGRPPRCWAFLQVSRAQFDRDAYSQQSNTGTSRVGFTIYDCQGAQNCYQTRCFFLDKLFFNFVCFFQWKPDSNNKACDGRTEIMQDRMWRVWLETIKRVMSHGRGLYHPSMHTSEFWDTENYVVN